MSSFKRSVYRTAFGTAFAAALAAAAVTPARAAAGPGDTDPVSLSITVSTGPATTVGSPVTITVTGVNTSSATISGSLGIQISDASLLKFSSVSEGARNLGDKLIYKTDTQWAAGATLQIVLVGTAEAAGTDDFDVYSDADYSPVGDDLDAHATLTIAS
jgi:hypothetical protein